MSSAKHFDNEAPTPSGVYVSGTIQSSPAPQLSPVYQETERICVGSWEVGFCGCCTHCVPNCCMVTFCPCFSLAQISDRLGVMSYGATLAIYFVIEVALWAFYALASHQFFNDYDHWRNRVNNNGDFYDGYYHYGGSTTFKLGSSTSHYSWISGGVNLLVFVFVWHLRNKTRVQFNIPGSCCCDCCAAFWCSCCSMAQIATHIKSYKPGSCDFGPRDTLPAYGEGHAASLA